MGGKKDRFCILMEDSERLLFSVEEQKNGDLTIFPRHAKNFTGAGNPAIISQKYSLHLSPQNKDINVIKHTLDLENSRPHITRNFTKALKKENLWTPLYYRRFPSLDLERYNVPQRHKKKSIQLGEISRKCTLIQGLFVTNKNTKSSLNNYADISVSDYEYENFKICIFSSLLDFPPSITGWFSHFGVHEKIQGHLSWTHEGSSFEEIKSLFDERRNFLRNQFINEIDAELHNIKTPYNSLSKIIRRINPRFKPLYPISDLDTSKIKRAL